MEPVEITQLMNAMERGAHPKIKSAMDALAELINNIPGFGGLKGVPLAAFVMLGGDVGKYKDYCRAIMQGYLENPLAPSPDDLKKVYEEHPELVIKFKEL